VFSQAANDVQSAASQALGISNSDFKNDLTAYYTLGASLLTPTGTNVTNSGQAAAIPSQVLGGAYQLLTQGDPHAAEKTAQAQQDLVNAAQQQQNDLIDTQININKFHPEFNSLLTSQPI